MPWESCHWILPPWQQTPYIMGKSQKPNHHLLRGLVEWSHQRWDLGSREWCPGRLASAFSFMQQVLIEEHRRVERTPHWIFGNLGSSSATWEVGWSLSANLEMMILPRDLLCGPNGSSMCEGTCWCEVGAGNCWWTWLFLNGEIFLGSWLSTEHYASWVSGGFTGRYRSTAP